MEAQWNYSIKHVDEQYKQFCTEKSLLYLPSLLFTIVSTMKRSTSIDTILTNPFLKDYRPILLTIVQHSIRQQDIRRRILQR